MQMKYEQFIFNTYLSGAQSARESLVQLQYRMFGCLLWTIKSFNSLIFRPISASEKIFYILLYATIALLLPIAAPSMMKCRLFYSAA